jgi:Ca2+-binding EF-hand superfamily protein
MGACAQLVALSIRAGARSSNEGDVMTVGPQTRKFGRVFDWFDQTGDGWLTRSDFEKMAEMFKALAEEDDEANKTAMEKAFMFWWDTLLEAGDGEPADKIGKQQFIGIMHSSVIEPETFENAIGGIADGLIAALDTSGDGTLSQEEYVRMYDALGIPPETSGEAFRRLDRDGNGEISNAEFHQALFEYYLSDDENAPGNWLLGEPMPVT